MNISNCYQQRKNLSHECSEIFFHAVDKQKYIYTCYIDYCKAVDMVKNKSLVVLRSSVSIMHTHSDNSVLELNFGNNMRQGHQYMDVYQTRSKTEICGLSSLIRIIYENDYQESRHG